MNSDKSGLGTRPRFLLINSEKRAADKSCMTSKH